MPPRGTILFDVNETILDLSSLRPRFRAGFGDEAITETWFSMLLHSSTVCVLTEIKTDFASLAGTMLDTIAGRKGVALPGSLRDEILDGFSSLLPYTDVKPALIRLRNAGYQTVAFTNSSLDLVTRQIENAGLAEYYDNLVSVEPTGSFKPDARVYRFVAEFLERPIGELRLVSTHDWDAHGAIAAGMQAAYIDRSGAPYHPLYRQPDVCGATLEDIVDQTIAIDDRK